MKVIFIDLFEEFLCVFYFIMLFMSEFAFAINIFGFNNKVQIITL